ncbi:UNVERIFIED_ORG: hypothetical protein L601_002000000530 [Gordonia westfalica J30]
MAQPDLPTMDRYAHICRFEDLGGMEMFPDRTPDLVGAQKEGPDPAATGVEASDPHPLQEEEGTL